MDIDCPAPPAETRLSDETPSTPQPILIPRWLRVAMRPQTDADNGQRSGSRWQATRRH